ncbi:hypothetical protein C0966_05665 [Bacillus methanolicus]|nr:hypothetical protein [Bacillus methanolicus]
MIEIIFLLKNHFDAHGSWSINIFIKFMKWTGWKFRRSFLLSIKIYVASSICIFIHNIGY